jgi:hypothetical protein
VASHAMVGATNGISRSSQHDLPWDFARYATAGRFWRIFIRPDPAVRARYANGHPNIARIRGVIRGPVVAKSAGSGEQVFTSMDALLYGPTVACDGQFFAMEKRVRDHQIRHNLPLHCLISTTIS